MKQQIILTTGPLGGLGDHLVYSTLPERYTKLGFEVYVDAQNLTRNPETQDLVWAKNPYIIGTSDRRPNAGYCNQGKFYDVANKFPVGSIEAMERAHGLPPPYSLAPKIYYDPQPFKVDLRECVLFDSTSISSTVAVQGYTDLLTKMTDRFPGRQFYNVRVPAAVARDAVTIEGPSITMSTLYEYVDAIASCYAWVGSEAGGQMLAAAVRGEYDVYDMERRPEIISIISPKTYNSRGYTMRGVDYRVTVHGNVSSDYWEPVEVAYERYALMARRTVEEARAEFIAARAAKHE